MKILILISCFLCLTLAEKCQGTPYNQTLGLKYWDFARIATCDLSNILSLVCGPVCDKYRNELQYIQIAYYSKDQYLCWLAYSTIDDVIYLTFRGSMTFENWVHDFEFLQDSYPESNKYPYPEQDIHCKDCKVHSGFYHAYLDIRPTLLEAINSVSQKSNCTKLQIVGYSLGAGISTHFILDLLTTSTLKAMYTTNGILTMGCPRVGNKNFAHFFDGIVPTSYRVVHYEDIVPHLPPQWMDFYHTEQEVWYTSEDNLDYVLCESGEDPHCSDKEKVLKPSNHGSYFNEVYTEVYSYCSESSSVEKQ